MVSRMGASNAASKSKMAIRLHVPSSNLSELSIYRAFNWSRNDLQSMRNATMLSYRPISLYKIIAAIIIAIKEHDSPRRMSYNFWILSRTCELYVQMRSELLLMRGICITDGESLPRFSATRLFYAHLRSHSEVDCSFYRHKINIGLIPAANECR